MTRVVLVPGVPALLPAYRSLEDPVGPLRTACLEAVRWLGPAPRVVADAQGLRVAEALLAEVGVSTRSAVDGLTARPADGASGGRAASVGEASGGRAASASERVETPAPQAVLVVGNGSARRTDASPGPFDPRAVPFDDAVGAALRSADTAALRAVDASTAEELWADTARLTDLADLLEGARLVGVDYDDAPYGVQYWVMRWQA